MQLTFKDLKQQKFTLDAEPSDTIAQVKEKIFKHKSEEKEWDPSLQKLIYSGKILADDKTVEFYKVEEKGFIVCMLAKPKVAPGAAPSKPPATPAQPSKVTAAPPAPAPAPAPAPVAFSPSPAPAVSATPTPVAAAAPASFNDPSALAMGAHRESAIANMIEMGFPRNEIDAAMRAAYNNPDRAVEYLMTGIPEHLQLSRPTAPAAAAPAAAAPATAQAPAAPAAAAATTRPATDPENINLFEAAAAAARNPGGATRAAAPASAAGAGLDFLRNNGQFQQLRRLVQESPAMLEPILQQVGQGNPQLAALISQNPEAFLQLLAEGVEGDEGDGGFLQTIDVTPEEVQAIDRLCALGFGRDAVIQAFIACDKNEELTANYLFDNPADDDDDNLGA